MARPKSNNNRDLPQYLKNNGGYYNYRHPMMKRAGKPAIAFKKDREAAIAFAEQANEQFEQLARDPASVTASCTPHTASLGHVIARFREEYMPLRGWSDGYTRETNTRLNKIDSAYGARRFADLGVIDVKEIIHLFQGDGRRHARNTLIHVFAYAISNGLSDRSLINYAEKVALPPKQKRQRPRIADLDEYRKMRETCPDWLQDAMDLALITLQRRVDIVSLRLKDVRKAGGQEWMHFIPQKTVRHGTALKIPVGANLKGILTRCRERALRTGCPFLICTPQKETHNSKGRKAHRCQVLPEYVTRTFKECTGRQFHEIRSLGERVYESMGYTPEQIRTLGGWKDDKMRKLYGETDEIQYLEAVAGMEVSPK